jgi:hypothetical protein
LPAIATGFEPKAGLTIGDFHKRYITGEGLYEALILVFLILSPSYTVRPRRRVTMPTIRTPAVRPVSRRDLPVQIVDEVKVSIMKEKAGRKACRGDLRYPLASARIKVSQRRKTVMALADHRA